MSAAAAPRRRRRPRPARRRLGDRPARPPAGRLRSGKLRPRRLPAAQGRRRSEVSVGAKIASTDGSDAAAAATDRRSRSTASGTSIPPACRSARCARSSRRPPPTPSRPAATLWSAKGSFSANVVLSQQAPFPSDGQALRLQRPAARAARRSSPTSTAPTRSRPPSRSPFDARANQGHLRHRPARLAARGHRRRRLHHRPLAEPRPQLLLPRRAPQLPDRRLPRAEGLPRRRLPLRPGDARLRRRQDLATTLNRSCKVR